jgi:Mn2+/Fe2+ NRAMP family transporter
MGKFANGPTLKLLLWAVAAVVIGLNVALLKVLIVG